MSKQLNDAASFKLMATRFLREPHTDSKRTVSLMGTINEHFQNTAITLEFKRLADTQSSHDPNITIEFTYFGQDGKRIDEVYQGPKPDATLIAMHGTVIMPYMVSSEMIDEGKYRYKMISVTNPENTMMFRETENAFDTLLATMLKDDLNQILGVKTMTEAAGCKRQPTQDELLAALPTQPNNWLPAQHLVPLATAIQKAIKGNPCMWLDQGRDYGCQTKYLNIRVDQRNGNFIVAGDMHPRLVIDGAYPDHFYPQGWAGCNLHPGFLKMILDLNELTSHKVTREQVRQQVAVSIDAMQQMVAQYALNINVKKTVTGEQLMRYYGKK